MVADRVTLLLLLAACSFAVWPVGVHVVLMECSLDCSSRRRGKAGAIDRSIDRSETLANARPAPVLIEMTFLWCALWIVDYHPIDSQAGSQWHVKACLDMQGGPQPAGASKADDVSLSR